MADESRSYRWEVAWIRVRSYAYTGIRLFGLALIALGAWAIFAPGLIDYYQQEGEGVPDTVLRVHDVMPVLDEITALVVIVAGLVILHLSTRPTT